MAGPDLTLAHTGFASRRRGWWLLARFLVTALGIGAWFWTQSLIGRRHLDSSKIGDFLQSISAPLNGYLVLHPAAANALLIVTSGIVDLLALFLFSPNGS